MTLKPFTHLKKLVESLNGRHYGYKNKRNRKERYMRGCGSSRKCHTYWREMDFQNQSQWKWPIREILSQIGSQGYAQRYEIDYTEVFALVDRLDIVRVLLVVATQSVWEVF